MRGSLHLLSPDERRAGGRDGVEGAGDVLNGSPPCGASCHWAKEIAAGRIVV